MELVTITAPDYTAGPVSLADVKNQCRVDGTDDDADLDLKRLAALMYVSARIGRPLAVGTYEARFDCWRQFFRLPLAPLTEITSVTYQTSAEVSETVDESTYLFDSTDRGGVRLAYAKTWPIQALSPNRPITVRFLAGYEDADAVPDPIKMVVLLLVGHWYRNREAVTLGNNEISKNMEMAVDALLAQYVVDPLGAGYAQ